MTLDSASPLLNTASLPKHGPLISDRVEYFLRKEVALRRHEPNAQLKHEADLAEQFSVSRKTIRTAVDRLKKEGLVYAIRGKGTFIKSQQRNNITLVSSNQYHPYNTTAVGVVTSLLRQQGYNTNLIISNDLKQDWDHIEDEQTACIGTMLVGQFRDQNLRWLANHAKTPFVLVGDCDSAVRSPTTYNHVLPNNSATAFRATDYLLSLGHTQIGYLTWGELDKFAYIKESSDGFLAALQNRGIEPDPAWCIALPAVHFAEGEQIPAFSPLGKTKRQFDDWFNNGNTPTALIIHSSLELQIRDILDTYCRNHFTLESVVAITAYEQLRISYGGMGQMTATCYRFEYLAKRALTILTQQQNQPNAPVREICDQNFMCFRKHGVWQTTPAPGSDLETNPSQVTLKASPKTDQLATASVL